VSDMARRYPKGSRADELLSDKERTARIHRATFIEQECPNVIDIVCACGWYNNTPWGVEQAKINFTKHLIANDALPWRVFL
jgi:hypothetical protein